MAQEDVIYHHPASFRDVCAAGPACRRVADESTIFEIVAQLALGVGLLHEAGVDSTFVAPPNVFMHSVGPPANFVHAAVDAARALRPDTMGELRDTAAEQWAGRAATHKVASWRLGTVLYMLAHPEGAHPIAAADDSSSSVSVLRARACRDIPLDDLRNAGRSEALLSLLALLLAPDETERPTVGEMLNVDVVHAALARHCAQLDAAIDRSDAVAAKLSCSRAHVARVLALVRPVRCGAPLTVATRLLGRTRCDVRTELVTCRVTAPRPSTLGVVMHNKGCVLCLDGGVLVVSALGQPEATVSVSRVTSMRYDGRDTLHIAFTGSDALTARSGLPALQGVARAINVARGVAPAMVAAELLPVLLGPEVVPGLVFERHVGAFGTAGELSVGWDV